jgi:hypothetical protein
LNARAFDIQYYYAWRLPGEPAEGVDDIHFHPVEPRQVPVALSWGSDPPAFWRGQPRWADDVQGGVAPY